MKKVVSVKIQSGEYSQEFSKIAYDFFALDDVVAGDWVVVTTKAGHRLGLVVSVKVASNHAKSYIVQRVDFKAYNEKVEKQKKAEELKAILDYEIKKSLEMEKYQHIYDTATDESIKQAAAAYLEIMR